MKTPLEERKLVPGHRFFDDIPRSAGIVSSAAKGSVLWRVCVGMPNRHQVELRLMDGTAAAGRSPLAFGGGLGDAASHGWHVLQDICAGREIGRSAIAPEILFALRRYAILVGVGNSREIARLVKTHDACRRIGGVLQGNYHSLTDFRVEHGSVLDGRRQIPAALQHTIRQRLRVATDIPGTESQYGFDDRAMLVAAGEPAARRTLPALRALLSEAQ